MNSAKSMRIFMKPLVLKFTLGCVLVVACQAAPPTGSVVQTSTPTPEVSAPLPLPVPTISPQLPSPAPSTAAPGEVQPVPQFTLSSRQPCVGDSLTVTLLSSPFNRSLIPISLQKSPAASAVTTEAGGNKQPPTPYEDTVLLGNLSVSPTGEGAFTFSLQSQYTTRKGEELVIELGQRYSLYWEPRPEAFSYIGDFTAC